MKKESRQQEKNKNDASKNKANKSKNKKYTTIGSINIPSLNIKYDILSKTSEQLLKISINKYWGQIQMKLEICVF